MCALVFVHFSVTRGVGGGRGSARGAPTVGDPVSAGALSGQVAHPMKQHSHTFN